MKLIDKDAVLAIIEKRKQRIYPKRTDYTDGQKSELVNLSLEINSLEVKEVDLEKEIERVRKTHFINDDFEEATLEGRQITNIAKHFFKLGVNASNPLTWEDIKILEEKSSEVFAEVAKGKVEYYSIYPTQQSFLEEVLKRFKAQKGE